MNASSNKYAERIPIGWAVPEQQPEILRVRILDGHRPPQRLSRMSKVAPILVLAPEPSPGVHAGLGLIVCDPFSEIIALRGVAPLAITPIFANCPFRPILAFRAFRAFHPVPAIIGALGIRLKSRCFRVISVRRSYVVFANKVSQSIKGSQSET